MELIFETEYVKIYVYQQAKCCFIEWQTDLIDDYYVVGAKKALETTLANKFHKMIYDDRKISKIDIIARVRVLTEVVPDVLKKFGNANAYVGIIASPHLSSLSASKIVMQSVSRMVANLKVEYFKTPEEAWEWINSFE